MTDLSIRREGRRHGQLDQDDQDCCSNARTIANRLKSFSYIYTKYNQDEQRNLLQFRLSNGNIFYVRGQANGQEDGSRNRVDTSTANLGRLGTYSRYFYSYHHQHQYQSQLMLNNYFNQSIIYYNNLILVLVILFIIFTVLVLLEDADHPYYNLSTIIFLLLVLFNLIILVFAHNFAKQFLLSKNLVYYR